MAFRGRGRGRGEARPYSGRGGKAFSGRSLRDEGLRITVPNFGTPSQPPPEIPVTRSSGRGSEPSGRGPNSGPVIPGSNPPQGTVPGFKTNAFKPIGGSDSPQLAQARSRSSHSPVPTKRPVGERLGPPLEPQSSQRESIDDYEPISPEPASPRHGTRPSAGYVSPTPDESIRITVGNERYQSQEPSRDRPRENRDSNSRRDPGESRDSRGAGRYRDDDRDSRSSYKDSKSRDRGYRDSKDRDRNDSSNRGYKSDRDRDQRYDKERRSDKGKRRDSPSRRSGSPYDDRNRGRHSRETSEDSHSRSSRQDSHSSRNRDAPPNSKKQKDDLDLYGDLPAPENLSFPSPQEDIFKSSFLSNSWERIASEERERQAREKEEQERHLRDAQQRERQLRDEILRENSERQSRQQEKHSAARHDMGSGPQREEDREERVRESHGKSSYLTDHRETLPHQRDRVDQLPGLSDAIVSSQAYHKSPPPPAREKASILPGMALSMDIEDEDDFLYGGDNDDQDQKSSSNVERRNPEPPIRQASPVEVEPSTRHRTYKREYTDRHDIDRREEEPEGTLSQSQTELLKKRILGHEELVLSLLNQDNLLQERLQSIATGDPRQEALRQKQRELVELLTGLSSGSMQQQSYVNPPRPAEHGTFFQPSQHDDHLRPALSHPGRPLQARAAPPAVVPTPEPEKPSTDSDPTIKSILKSIGFNFELSKLMQEKAQEQRDKLVKKVDNLDTYGIKQASSFLKEGLSNVDIGSVFDAKVVGTPISQKKSSILSEPSLSYEERARRYKEEQMKAYAQGKASPPPFDESVKEKKREPSPDPYSQGQSSTAPYYQDNPYDSGYSQTETGYEERAFIESSKPQSTTEYGYSGYDGTQPGYGQEAPNVITSNLTVIQPVDTGPAHQATLHQNPPPDWQNPAVSSYQGHSDWEYPDHGGHQDERQTWQMPQTSLASAVPPGHSYSGEAPRGDPSMYPSGMTWLAESSDPMQAFAEHLRAREESDRLEQDKERRSKKQNKGSSSGSSKTSNRTVLPPRNERRRGPSPGREQDRDMSPQQERRRVYSPGPRQDRKVALRPEQRPYSPEHKIKRMPSPGYLREREQSPRRDSREYGRLPSPTNKPERLPSPGMRRERSSSSIDDRPLSPPRHKPDFDDKSRGLPKKSREVQEPVKVVMTWDARDKLAREMEERHKRLRALSRELERLRQQHNELLRKKKRQKDGHKDPLLLENSKLQDEIAKQISTLRKAAEDNAARLAKAKAPAMKKLSAELVMTKAQFHKPNEADIKTPGEILEEQKAAQIKIFKEEKVLKEEVKEEPEKDKIPANTSITVKKTITVEKKEIKKVVKKAEKHYEYYDPGNHWCDICNRVTGGLNDMLQHMHGSQHQGNMDPYNRPWLPESLKTPATKLPKANVMVAPLTGVEFLLPTRAFYCSLCKVLTGDVTCAEEHIKTHTHNQKYQVYLNDNPYYEKKRNLDKAARLTHLPEDFKRKAESLEFPETKRPKAEEKSFKDSESSFKKRAKSPPYGKGSKRYSRSPSRSRSRSYGRSRDRRSRSSSRGSSYRNRSSKRSPRRRSRSRSPRRRSRSRSKSPRHRSRSNSPRHRSRSPRYKKHRRSRSPRHSSRKSRSRDRSPEFSKAKSSYPSGKSPDKRNAKSLGETKSAPSSKDSDDKKRFSIKLSGKSALMPTNILRGPRGGRKVGSKPLIMPPKEPSFLLRKKITNKDGKDKDEKDGAEGPAPLAVFLSIGDGAKSQAGKSLPVLKDQFAKTIDDAFKGKGEDPLQKEIEKAEKEKVVSVAEIMPPAPVKDTVALPPQLKKAGPAAAKTAALMTAEIAEKKLLGIDTVPSVDMVRLPPPPPPPQPDASTKATTTKPPQAAKESASLYSIFYGPKLKETTVSPPKAPAPGSVSTNSSAFPSLLDIPMPALPAQAKKEDTTASKMAPKQALETQPASAKVDGQNLKVNTALKSTAEQSGTVQAIAPTGVTVTKITAVPDDAVAMATEATESTVTMATEATESTVPMATEDTEKTITMATEAAEKTVPMATEATEKTVTVTSEPTQSTTTMATEATESTVPMATEATESTVPIATKAAEKTVTMATEVSDITVTMATEATETTVTLATEATKSTVPMATEAIEKIVTNATEATEKIVTMATEATESTVPMATEATETTVTLATEATESAVLGAANDTVSITTAAASCGVTEAATTDTVTLAMEATEMAVDTVSMATEATEESVTQAAEVTPTTTRGAPNKLVESREETVPTNTVQMEAMQVEEHSEKMEESGEQSGGVVKQTEEPSGGTEEAMLPTADVEQVQDNTGKPEEVKTQSSIAEVVPEELVKPSGDVPESTVQGSCSQEVPTKRSSDADKPLEQSDSTTDLLQNTGSQPTEELMEFETTTKELIEQDNQDRALAEQSNDPCQSKGKPEEPDMAKIEIEKDSTVSQSLDLTSGLRAPAGLEGAEEQMMTDLMEPLDDSVVSELMQSLQDPEIRDMPTLMEEPTVTDLLAGMGGGDDLGPNTEGDFCSEAIMEMAKLARSVSADHATESTAAEEPAASSEPADSSESAALDTAASAADTEEQAEEGPSASNEDAESQESGSPVRQLRKRPGRKRRGGKRR